MLHEKVPLKCQTGLFFDNYAENNLRVVAFNQPDKEKWGEKNRINQNSATETLQKSNSIKEYLVNVASSLKEKSIKRASMLMKAQSSCANLPRSSLAHLYIYLCNFLPLNALWPPDILNQPEKA